MKQEEIIKQVKQEALRGKRRKNGVRSDKKITGNLRIDTGKINPKEEI